MKDLTYQKSCTSTCCKLIIGATVVQLEIQKMPLYYFYGDTCFLHTIVILKISQAYYSQHTCRVLAGIWPRSFLSYIKDWSNIIWTACCIILSTFIQVHRKHGFVDSFSKLRTEFDNDCLISFLGRQAQKLRSKMNSPGSPAGCHGPATASKMAPSLNLIEPSWFRHQSEDRLQRETTFFFKNRGFYLVLVISRGFQKTSNTEDVIRPQLKRFRPFIT